jgi:hypothetical protein
MADAYNPYLVDDDDEGDEQEEIATTEWNWVRRQ